MSFKRLSKSSSAFPPPLELGKKNSAIHPDPHSTLQPRSSELHEGVTKVLYIFSKLLLAICLWAELVTSTWSPKWKRKNKTDHASSRLYISQTNWFWTPLWISPMSQVQNGQNSREFRLSWLFHTCTTNGHLRCGIKTWCTLCQIFVCDKRCPTLFTRFRSMFSCFCVFCLQKLSSRFFPTPVFSALASWVGAVPPASAASCTPSPAARLQETPATGPLPPTTPGKTAPKTDQHYCNVWLHQHRINQSITNPILHLLPELRHLWSKKWAEKCIVTICHILLEQLQIVAISNVRVTSMVLLLIWTSLKLPLIGGAFSKSRPNQIIQIQLWKKWSNKAITPKAIKPLPSAKNFSRTYVGVSRRSWLWCDSDCKECRWSHQLQGVIGDSWRSILPKSESCNSGSIDRRQCQKQERWSGLRWGCECFGYTDFTALALCKSLEWEIET